jgi:hypothetical protein
VIDWIWTRSLPVLKSEKSPGGCRLRKAQAAPPTSEKGPRGAGFTWVEFIATVNYLVSIGLNQLVRHQGRFSINTN